MNDNKAPVGRRYIDVPVRSALPLWGAAAVWIFAAIFIPMYNVWHIILTAAVSAAVGFVIFKILPKEYGKVEVPFASGDLQLDKIIGEIDRASDRLEAARSTIAKNSPGTADKIEQINSTVDRIREALIASPDDVGSVRRFINYYLPTTVKLAEKYEVTSSSGASGENAKKTLSDIDGILDQIKLSFDRQYDALFEDDVIDVSSDIKVLETMLERDDLK